MTEAGTRDSALRWEVFVTPGIPTVASDSPRHGTADVVADIFNPRLRQADAVLVDTFITVDQARALVDWSWRAARI